MMIWFVSGVASGEVRARRVLMLHSFGRDFSPDTEAVERFRTRLGEISPEPVEISEASLEMARFDGADRDRPLLEFLREVHVDRPPDLLVPVGAPAALFLARHRDALFPETPMLVLAADKRRLPEFAGARNMVSVGLDLDLDGYLRNILEVLPDTRQVHVVMGAAPLDRFWENALKQEWAEFGDRVTFHWQGSRSVRELAETFADLPPDSAVFVGLLNRDAAGVAYEEKSVLRMLHAKSNAPLFGFLTVQMGEGIVGGRLAPMVRVGEEGAEAAKRILAGEPLANIPPVALELEAPVYDWRELKRWNIPESRLPAGSTVLHRHSGIWDDHRPAVILTVVLVAILLALIASLLAARRQAREMAASLNLAADAAKIGLWRRMPRSTGITSNLRWRRIFGLPDEGGLEKSEVLDRLPPEDRVRMTDAFSKSAKDNEPFAFEHRVIHPDGSVRWVATHGRAVREGGAYGTTGASFDITERREATAEAARQRQELAHLSRVSSLGVLSGALAHELNQPLAIILSNAQAAEFLLEEDSPDLDELRAILSDIVKEDRRAGDVIRRLRTLLRRGETTPQPIDVNESVREVLKLTHSDLIARNVTAASRLDEPLPSVLADRVQLQQVLLNLIVNACDAMAGNDSLDRVLVVETHATADGVRISVRDHGTGITGDPEKLFEPFHTTKESGLGMGLAISRTLIEAYQGRLWAEPNPGRGTVFHATLPRTDPPP